MEKHESHERGQINGTVYACQRLREPDGASERGKCVQHETH